MRCAVLFCAVLTAVFAEEPAIQTGTPHRFLCGAYSDSKVCIVDAAGKVEWSHAASGCNDVWALPDGHVLFVTGHGVQEVDKEGKTVFEYTSKSEIYACQRLPDGNTFVGECNAGRLLVVDPKGTVVKETRILPEGKTDGGHGFIRNARCLPNGNYLVAHYSGNAVREYEPSGKVVLDIPVPGGAHSCLRLPNGNTLIGVSDHKKDARVIEVDPSGKTVWEVGSKDIGIDLWFVGGLQRLPNGNTVMSNWIGHGHIGKAPHVIEVTRDKQVVWTFADHKTFKTIASIQVLDVPGDAIKGEVLH